VQLGGQAGAQNSERPLARDQPTPPDRREPAALRAAMPAHPCVQQRAPFMAAAATAPPHRTVRCRRDLVGVKITSRRRRSATRPAASIQAPLVWVELSVADAMQLGGELRAEGRQRSPAWERRAPVSARSPAADSPSARSAPCARSALRRSLSDTPAAAVEVLFRSWNASLYSSTVQPRRRTWLAPTRRNQSPQR
jgi:hypothetical protein